MIEGILANAFNIVFSEYGAFVGFLLVCVFFLWKRNEALSDALVELSRESTKTLTELTVRLEGINTNDKRE